MQGPARPSGAILLALLAKLSVKALPAKMSTAKRFSSLQDVMCHKGSFVRQARIVSEWPTTGSQVGLEVGLGKAD